MQQQPEFHLYKVTVYITKVHIYGDGETPKEALEAREMYVAIPGGMMFGVSDAILRNPPKDDDGRPYTIVRIDKIENMGPVLIEGDPCSTNYSHSEDEKASDASRSKSGKEST